MAVPKKRKTMEEYAQAFVEAVEGGINKFADSAKIYVEALDDKKIDSEQFRTFCREKAPFVPQTFWRDIEKVGRGMQHWKLMIGDGGCHVAKIRRLPLSVQNDIVNGVKFKMLTSNNEVLKVDVRNLSSDVARRLFAKDHIRAIAEQKVWLAEHVTPTEEPQAESLPIKHLSGGRIRVLKNTILTKADLKRILMEL